MQVRCKSDASQDLFKKIYNEIKYLCKVATAGSKEAGELKKVKKAFENAWKDSVTAEKNTNDEGDVKEQARFKGHPNIDKSSHNKDNISRANKQGDFINEFYNALSKSEWRHFYKALAYEGYLQKTKIGEIAPIVIEN